MKTVLTQAIKAAFGDDAVDEQFRGLNVSIEYPVQEQDFPGIWVDFDPTQALETVGIGHQEDVLSSGSFTRALRFKFSGYATYTVSAFSSLERDRLFDAVVRALVFEPRFRTAIEDNAHIGMVLNFDQVEQRGFGAQPGTPWGTDDVIYEATLAILATGEFLVTANGSYLPISAINLYSWNQSLEFDPTTGFSDPDAWIG